MAGVDGAAGSDVWAVGEQAAGSSNTALVEHWNGSSWSVFSSPKLPKGSGLRAVTAPASSDAWAAGFTGSNALVEHWNGSAWSVISSPAFTGVSTVTGIAADSSSDVWAVGSLSGGGTTSLHWDGSTWTKIPVVPLRFDGVTAVAALSPTNVWAVGTGPGVANACCAAHPTAVIEHWDGSSWAIVATPSGISFLAGMASGGSTVLAVGQGTNSSGIILSN